MTTTTRRSVRSLGRMTQADADLWLMEHARELRRDSEAEAQGARPQWGADQEHGVSVRGSFRFSTQDGRTHLPFRRHEGMGRDYRILEEGPTEGSYRRRRISTSRSGSATAQGLTGFDPDTLHHEVTEAREMQVGRELVARVEDGHIIHEMVFTETPSQPAGGPVVLSPMVELDADGCPAARIRTTRHPATGRFLRHRPDSRGRFHLSSGGRFATEDERRDEIAPLFPSRPLVTDFVRGVIHLVEHDRPALFAAETFCHDLTDYGTCSHDPAARLEVVRTQLRIHGDIRPGTLGRVRSSHASAARVDRSAWRFRESVLDSALRLGFLPEPPSPSDTLSLDAEFEGCEDAEPAWVPTTDDLMAQWLRAETSEGRAHLEAIDWVQRRLTASQWECLTAEDLSSDAVRRQRSRALRVVTQEMPIRLRIRRRFSTHR